MSSLEVVLGRCHSFIQAQISLVDLNDAVQGKSGIFLGGSGRPMCRPDEPANTEMKRGKKRRYFSDMLCFGVRTVLTASSVFDALCSVHQYNVSSHNSSVGLLIASNVHGSLRNVESVRRAHATTGRICVKHP